MDAGIGEGRLYVDNDFVNSIERECLFETISLHRGLSLFTYSSNTLSFSRVLRFVAESPVAIESSVSVIVHQSFSRRNCI